MIRTGLDENMFGSHSKMEKTLQYTNITEKFTFFTFWMPETDYFPNETLKTRSLWWLHTDA